MTQAHWGSRMDGVVSSQRPNPYHLMSSCVKNTLPPVRCTDTPGDGRITH